MAFVIVLLLLWVKQSLRSTEMSYRIQETEKLIEKESEQKNELEKILSQNLSLEKIESQARKSGWVIPSSSSVVIVPI